VLQILEALATSSNNKVFIEKLKNELASNAEPGRKDILVTARKALRYVISETSNEKLQLQQWVTNYIDEIQPKYSSHLYSESNKKATGIKEVKATYDDDAKDVDGRIVIRDNFDYIFGSNPNTLVFGEDSGNIGDVNQGLEGLQEKYGELRVADVGMRYNI